MKNLSIVNFLVLFSMCILALPASAFAAGPFQEFAGGICLLVQAMTGNVGRTIATLAIVFLGVGAFFGKVNWGLAVMVTVGIIAIFGAGQIVVSLGGEEECIAFE